MIKILIAFFYYLSSIPTLLLNSNFWLFPLLFAKKPVLIKLQGKLRFYVESLMDIWTIKEVILDNNYERFYRLKNNDIVVDIGASIGDFSIHASQRVKKVYALEMDRARIELLKKNIRLNKSDNIIVKNWEVKSLDELFKKLKLKKCNLLKIDCEGCEYNIFNKSTEYSLSKIKNIAMEIHLFNARMQKNYAALKKNLTANGFKMKEIDNPVHTYLRFLYASKFF